MAIPIGTTSKQLAVIVRWMCAAVVIVGMLGWWWPGYRSWGGLTVGLLAVLMMWLLWRIVAGESRVPGNPIHLALLGPGIILAVHLGLAGFGGIDKKAVTMGGAMNMSMLFHLALFSLAVMLTQSVFWSARRRWAALGACGMAMIGGAVMPLLWAQAQPVRGALALQALAGVGVWLSATWGAVPAVKSSEIPPWLRWLRVALSTIAVAAAVLVALQAPREMTLAIGVLGGLMILGGVIFVGGHRSMIVSGSLILLSAVVAGCIGGMFAYLGLASLAGGAFGLGEKAFDQYMMDRSGLEVLLRTIGWVGLAWVLLVGAGCGVGMLLVARRQNAHRQVLGLMWIVTAALATCALFVPGGAVIPSVTLSAAFVWGLVPAMVGRRALSRPGMLLVVPTLAMVVLMGMARSTGLIGWISSSFGMNDKFIHGAAGLFLAIMFAWLLGSRRLWLGLVGVAIAILIGLGGEVVQYFATGRNAELADWYSHVIGCVIVIVPYLLCMGSRWAESSDVIAPTAEADAYRSTSDHI